MQSQMTWQLYTTTKRCVEMCIKACQQTLDSDLWPAAICSITTRQMVKHYSKVCQFMLWKTTCESLQDVIFDIWFLQCLTICLVVIEHIAAGQRSESSVCCWCICPNNAETPNLVWVLLRLGSRNIIELPISSHSPTYNFALDSLCSSDI
jgi:small-conductance mechanosensitive channel